MSDNQDNGAEVRIDMWLWAARFFKTRSLAADAVNGGKVAINGARAKPSRTVRIGDRLKIRRGPVEWTVTVNAVAGLRRPAAEAQLLYRETEESVQQREAVAARLRLEQPPRFEAPGRPSKRDRRVMEKYLKKTR